MRAILIFLTLTVLGNKGFCQSTEPSAPVYNTHQELAKALVANCRTDSAKAYTIFRWITDNISYDVKMFTNGEDYYFSKLTPIPLSITGPEFDARYHDQIANYVLKNKMGVCMGYASLFKALCNDAGLECLLIIGYAKRPEMIAEHAWNAVKYNNRWHLLDATWASGGIASYNGKYEKRYQPYYYDTPPYKMIYDHYPEKQEYGFMVNLIPLELFSQRPLIWPQFSELPIADFSPKTGRIYAPKDSVIEFTIKFNKPVKTISVMSEPGEELVCNANVAEVKTNNTRTTKKNGTKPKQSAKSNPKISKKEKALTDTLFSYIDTVTNYVHYTRSYVETDDIESPTFANYTYIGKTFSLKYKVEADIPLTLHFIVNDEPVISYVVGQKK